MKLNPKKILETKFDAVINGYSPTKVDQFLDLIIEDYNEMIQENMQLKEKIKILETQMKKKQMTIEKLEQLFLKQELEKQESTNNENNDKNDFELKE